MMNSYIVKDNSCPAIPMCTYNICLFSINGVFTISFFKTFSTTFIYNVIFIDYRTATESDKSEKNGSNSVSALFHLLVPLMKCESADMRDTIVNGLGYTNPAVFKLVFEPRQEVSNNIICATSRASDQPAHTCSLIRAFASRLNIL